jgi:hypothetical protein
MLEAKPRARTHQRSIRILHPYTPALARRAGFTPIQRTLGQRGEDCCQATESVFDRLM